MFSKLTQGQQVFAGVFFGMSFSAVTFFGFPSKKAGHNLMDTERPHQVQIGMDKHEEMRLNRLARASKNGEHQSS